MACSGPAPICRTYETTDISNRCADWSRLVTSLCVVDYLRMERVHAHVTSKFWQYFRDGSRQKHSYNHRSVLNILDSLLANQIPAKGVVTIVCRIEIQKMAEC